MKRTIFFVAFSLLTMIVNAQIYRTVDIFAGGLSTELTNISKSIVTNLTITGTIDARDFKTMRDELPNLSWLNISGATIATYTGTEGPVESQSLTYQQNTIPHFAFCQTNIPIGKKTLTEVILPSNITSFGQCAFYDCSGLVSITIPSSVTYFDSWAFSRAGNNLSFTIPASVTSMSNFVFEVFNGSIHVDPANPNFASENGALFNKNKTTLIQCPGSKTDFTIPPSVTTIGMSAFSHCKALTGIFRIPPTVKIIRSSAFRNCDNLTTLVIPSSVDTIENGAFNELMKLTSLYAYDNLPINLSNASNVFHLINKTKCTLYVPFQTKSLYQAAPLWSEFVNIKEMSDQCVDIRDFPYKQDFSSGGLPYCWSIVDNVGNGQVWVFNNPGNRTVSTPTAANGFAIIDSEIYGSGGMQNCDLISNSFDFTYYQNINVWFRHNYKHHSSSKATLFYSSDKGNNWYEKTSWTEDRLGHLHMDFGSHLNGRKSVIFKWNYTGSDGLYWAIDDFEVLAERIPVQESQFIQNRTLPTNLNICYDAINQIVVAGNNSYFIIEEGATSNFIAGNSIHFLPGFHAQEGSKVNAYITTNASFCYENALPSSPLVIPKKSAELKDSELVTNRSNETKKIKLFPNPNNGQFNIELTNYNAATVEIYSLLGAKIVQLNNMQTGIYPLNMGMQKGIYILKVNEGEKQAIQKFVVQ